MTRYIGEADFTHDQPQRIGVLIANLGTPEAPTPAAVRRYLAEFLSDPRVIELPRLLWWLLPPWGQYAACSILHDYLLAEGTPWAEAAWWLDESLRVQGITDYRRWLITAGVVAWGGWLWAKRTLSRVVARWRK